MHRKTEQRKSELEEELIPVQKGLTFLVQVIETLNSRRQETEEDD